MMGDRIDIVEALSDVQAEIDHIDFLTLELNDVIRKQEIRKRFLMNVRMPALEKLGTELASSRTDLGV